MPLSFIRKCVTYLRRIFLPFSIACYLLPSPAIAAPLPADVLPQGALEVCDAEAAPFERYNPKILVAVEALAGMGVFDESDFRDVKIGFCDLRRMNGPAATTSCAHDTILMDSGYAGKNKSIVLNATLAHEMIHVFQHRAKRAAFGDGYCSSDQYAADKASMEIEADAFGDAVGALFFSGRGVEIQNDCPVAVSVYLEAERPVSTKGGFPDFIDIAPGETVSSPERSYSKVFRYHARSKPLENRAWVWGSAYDARDRIIDGEAFGVKQIALANRHASTGPFLLHLSCDSDKGGEQGRIRKVRER